MEAARKSIGYGKAWEKLPVNKKTNKVIKVKMHVKTGDHVIVIAGSDKGKTGDITRVNNPNIVNLRLSDSRSPGSTALFGWTTSTSRHADSDLCDAVNDM